MCRNALSVCWPGRQKHRDRYSERAGRAVEGVPCRLLLDTPRRHCTAMPPGGSYQTSQICLKPHKTIGPNGFPFDRLMTPTSSLSPTELAVTYLLRHNFNVTAFSCSQFTLFSLVALLPRNRLVLWNMTLHMVITLAEREEERSKT